MILASGCFDGLHAAHVVYLKAAAAIDPQQPLVVAIAPDSYIRTRKGREPYWSQWDRGKTVQALRWVDAVHLQGDDSVAAVIREKQPAVFAKGPDWSGRLPSDVIAACRELGTRIAFVGTQGTHTSEARR